MALRRQGSNTDREVQSTNDDAQISKLSCVNAGYLTDSFVQYFVKTPSRRSPLINRGYFSRGYAMRILIDAFLERCTGQSMPCQIISLGAGFDTTWFCLKNDHRLPHIYIELDFQEVTWQKVNIIRSTPQLASLVDDDAALERGCKDGRLITESISILPVDLRDLKSVDAALSLTQFDNKMPTLIAAECVLVYLDPEHGAALVKYFGEKMDDAAFVVYEQIRPDDAFGRQMVKNLEERGCPLRGLRSTPSLATHELRFKENTWKRATAIDMNTIYKTVIPHDEHLRISKLELFDEFEEWHMIQEHYCICIGVNETRGHFKGFGFKALQR